jgi:hypothetical protein
MPDKVDFYTTKRTATKARLSVDFAGEMESGDTVASATVTATDDAAADVSASLISTISASGTKVLWTLKGWGTQGANYYVRVTATTTQGDVLPKVVRLRIDGA